MFDNIGKKIMGLAKVLCWVGIAVSVIMGICVMVAGAGSNVSGIPAALIGILTIVLGALFSWIGSWITYGFGRLVDNSEALRKED